MSNMFTMLIVQIIICRPIPFMNFTLIKSPLSVIMMHIISTLNRTPPKLPPWYKYGLDHSLCVKPVGYGVKWMLLLLINVSGVLVRKAGVGRSPNRTHARLWLTSETCTTGNLIVNQLCIKTITTLLNIISLLNALLISEYSPSHKSRGGSLIRALTSAWRQTLSLCDWVKQ